jgi:hypothetical protein
MKAADAVKRQASSTATRALAQTLVDQLIEIMPELKEVCMPYGRTS